PGATGSSYSPSVAAADNGAHFSVLVSNNVNTVMSANATLTVGSLVPQRGAMQQIGFGKQRGDVTNGSLNSVTADRQYTVPVFKSLAGQGDNYAVKLNAVFVPPTTGNYVWFVNGYDDADLFVSTDANAANKLLVAQEL